MNMIFLLTLVLLQLISGFADSANDEITLPPMKTFYESCARCHGNEGESFITGLKKLSDSELYNITEEMMFGPAFLEPNHIDVEAMTSYMKSIATNYPFAVSKKSAEGVFTILEISDSTVTIVDDNTYSAGRITELNYKISQYKITEIELLKGNTKVKFSLEKSRFYPEIIIGSDKK